ncbi:hypothetical protein PENSPDRAFT_543315, partial [Peniophora sp. CONT]
KFWALYLDEARVKDKQRLERWKGDTDGILIFTGLFAATVATFAVASYSSLSPDSGDETVVLLQQLLTLMNNSQPLNSSVIPSSDAFSPATSDVCVNALWFLSLFVSVSCALLAILVQQWARQYTQDTQRSGSPSARGPVHLVLSSGIDKFWMEDAIGFITSLIHVAVALFFAGLMVFLLSL